MPADPATIAIAQADALRRIMNVVEKHDPDQVERLAKFTRGGTMPHSVKMPNEVMTLLSESVAVLAELVDQHLEESKPRPRGRPRKDAA